jgi:PKD repeat protein
MPPQITCPHCGNTINLENRKEVDFEKITYALNNSSKTFTQLLEITNLPRKTLSLRLKDLCNSGSIVKDGGYRLSTSFRTYKKISEKNGNGKMKAPILRMGKNVQWIPIALIVCLVIVAFGSAMMISTPTPSPSAPTASFFYLPSSNIVAGNTVSFDAALSKASSGSITGYYWDFGDGSLSTVGQVVNHTYDTEGTYTITLIVKDAHGLTTSTQKTVDVSPVPRPAMVIKFTVSPDPTTVNAGWENKWIVSKPLTFDASACDESSGFITNYSWDFGDGETGTGVIVSHAYTNSGIYTVSLSVIDSNGAVQSITQQVQVLPMPEARIYVEPLPTEYQIGDTITLNIAISNVTDLWAWQAGMTFNPSVLQCISAAAPENTKTNVTTTAFIEGDFLKSKGNTWWFAVAPDNNAGIINATACTFYSPQATSVTGSGVLATVRFTVIGEGPLNIHLTSVILLNLGGIEIPVNVAT